MSHHQPNPAENINLTIDGIPVTVPEGTRILEAAREAGIIIPTLCDHPELRKRSVCRICVVEAGGRRKLLAACANDVWEGAEIITNNARIVNTRKAIIELLLADHPQDCLNCVRGGNCELQTLAADCGVREASFRHTPFSKKPKTAEGGIIVRDMDKCVKCGRCAEACESIAEVRAITYCNRGLNYQIDAPYHEALSGGPCIFCGHCARVCPVGAIYGKEEAAEVKAALSAKDGPIAVQFSPVLAAAFDKELNLPEGTVSSGQLVTALKRIGFGQVYNAGFFEELSKAAETAEVWERIQNGGTDNKLPLIACRSPDAVNFVTTFYSELAGRLCRRKTARQLFESYMQSPSGNTPAVATVTITADLSEKAETKAGSFTLTIKETAGLFKLFGVEFCGLPETAFDVPAAAENIQTANGKAEPKTVTAAGLAEVRAALNSMINGGCNAELLIIALFDKIPGQRFQDNSTAQS